MAAKTGIATTGPQASESAPTPMTGMELPMKHATK